MYTKSELKHILFKFDTGGEIDIWVNPRRTRIPVIKTGTELVDYIMLFGVLWLFINKNKRVKTTGQKTSLKWRIIFSKLEFV
jgi:hypothetical protein